MEKDLTEGFHITRKESSFIISPKGNITDILKAVYPGAIIGDCSKHTYENMFSLVVTSYNGEASVTVNFSVTGDVTGVEISPEVIEF